jgi:hypothetical protein
VVFGYLPHTHLPLSRRDEGPIPVEEPDISRDGMRWRGGSSATASSTPCELVPSPGSSPTRMQPASPSSPGSGASPSLPWLWCGRPAIPLPFLARSSGSGSSRHQAREIRRSRQACELVPCRHWRAPGRPQSQKRAGLGSWWHAPAGELPPSATAHRG